MMDHVSCIQGQSNVGFLKQKIVSKDKISSSVTTTILEIGKSLVSNCHHKKKPWEGGKKVISLVS